MASSPLTVDNLVGRQIKLLGRVQQVANTTNTTATIFKTGDSDYPLQSAFVAYVGVVTSDGLTIPATTIVAIGSSGSSDWSGGTIQIDSLGSPVVLYAQQVGGGTFDLPVYSQGVPFTVKVTTGGGSAQTLEFSAYGWGF